MRRLDNQVYKAKLHHTTAHLPYKKFSIMKRSFQSTGGHTNPAAKIDDASIGLVHQRPKLMRYILTHVHTAVCLHINDLMMGGRKDTCMIRFVNISHMSIYITEYCSIAVISPSLCTYLGSNGGHCSVQRATKSPIPQRVNIRP